MIASLAVVRRPHRRTHLAEPVVGDRVATLCGLDVPALDAVHVEFDMAGGATSRLMQSLRRELDDSTCLRCTRLAGIIVLCWQSRDRGRPW